MLSSSVHCFAPGAQTCSGPVVDELELLPVSGPVVELELLVVSVEVLVVLVPEVPGSVLVTGFVVEVVDIVAEPLPLSVTLVVGGVVVAVGSDVAVLDWVVLDDRVVSVVLLPSVTVARVSSLQAVARIVRPRNVTECFMVFSERRLYRYNN